MNAMTAAVFSYVLAGLISFFVAALIHLMVVIMTRMPKRESEDNRSVSDVVTDDEVNSDATIAAVIAIARNNC